MSRTTELLAAVDDASNDGPGVKKPSRTELLLRSQTTATGRNGLPLGAPEHAGGDHDEAPGILRRTVDRAGRLASQTLGGLARSTVATGAGAARLVGADHIADRLDEQDNAIRETIGEPEGLLEKTAAVGGRLVGDVAQFALPGAGLAKAAEIAEAAGASGRVFDVLAKLAHPKSVMGKIARDVVTGAPVNAAIAASAPENSTAGLLAQLTGNETLNDVARSPAKRAALEAATGMGLDALMHAGTYGVKALRAARSARSTIPVTAAHAAESAIPDAHDVAEFANRTERNPAAIADAINPDDYLNFEHFDLEPSGQKVLADEVTRVVDQHGLHPKLVVSWDETKRVAAKLGADPAAIVRPQKTMLTAPELLAVRNVVRRNVQTIAEQSRRLLDDDITEEGGQLAQRTIDALDSQNDELLTRLIGATSETGRALNSLRILANQTLDPAVWLVKAKRAYGGATQLPEAVRTDVLRFINTGDRRGLARYVASLRPATTGEKITAVYKANLLSGPPTSAKNILSNTSMAALETAKDPAAFVWDRIVGAGTSLLSGGKVAEMTKSAPLPSIAARSVIGAAAGALSGDTPEQRVERGMVGGLLGAALSRSAIRGAWLGLRDAKDALKGMPPEDALRKYDVYHETNFVRPGDPSARELLAAGKPVAAVKQGANAFLDAYTKSMFRFQVAQDRIFRAAALRRSLEEQAHLLARKEGLKGADLAGRVKQLIEAPTDEMSMRAIEAAEVATFNNRGTLGEMAQSAKRELSRRHPVLGTAAELIAPFTRTPSNVATRVVEYTAGGLTTIPDLVTLFRKATQGIPDAELQRKIVERLGRNTVGLAPIAAGFALAAHGRMTPSYAKDEREQSVWKLEGKMPNAVLEGGKWRAVDGISPIGNLMAVGANLYELTKNPDAGAADVAAGMYSTMGRTFSDDTFLRSAREAMDAFLTEPGRATRHLASNTAAALAVPNAIRLAARAADPTVRDPSTFAETVEERIPGASRSLPPKSDDFGRPIEREHGIVANALDPLTSRTPHDDELVRELARVESGIPRLSRGRDESSDDYRRRKEIIGQVTEAELRRFIASDSYHQIPRLAVAEVKRGQSPVFRQSADTVAKEVQRDEIEGVIRRIRTAVNRMSPQQREQFAKRFVTTAAPSQ